MQIKKIAVAVAAALAAGSSFALTTDQKAVLDSANAGNRVVFISGASAVQSGFTQIISTMFTGTPIRFANTTGSSRDYEAAAGTLAAGTGPWAGQTAIIIYRVRGGSSWGVNPVARAEAIESLNVTSAACGAAGTGTAASPYTCTTNTRVPDAGVSDVAPRFFTVNENIEGEIQEPPITPAQIADLNAVPIYGLSFGIPVTSNVPANVKFTRSTVAAIMTGNVGSWSAIENGGSGGILVCRRVQGSGTQAVMNLWAGQTGCSDLANTPADRSSGAGFDGTNYLVPPAGDGEFVVIENSTSGDVRTCLDRAVTGGTYATRDRSGNAITVNMGAGGHKAIGVLSMDSLSSSRTTGNWQFRSLDGAGKIVWDNTTGAVSTTGTGKFPTKEAYENGDWDLQGWISFNRPGRTLADANKAGLLQKFVDNARNPAILAASSSLKNVAMAIPGGLYTGDQVLDAAYLNNDQCGPYNRNFND
jgi:hypothetical protein